MYKSIKSDLVREDFVHALAEVNTFVDINVEDLMELHAKAEKHARIRMNESMRVSELMSQSVKTVRHDSSLSDAAHLLVVNKISGLPVIDASDKLVGIITEADFCVH